MAAVAVYIHFKFSTFEILLNLLNLSLVVSNNGEIVVITVNQNAHLHIN
jgi:hypothetical protein